MKRILLLSTVLLTACAAGGDTAMESSRDIHPRSNPNAVVTVTEFADLQCPACRAAHGQIVQPILDAYGNDIRYEFKHFPLRSIHRYALDVAEASECAADQGAFWEFVDLAFEKQPSLNRDVLPEWAGELDLDVKAFERCWKSRSKKEIVMKDYKMGRELDVKGTPTFFVNGVRVESGFDTISAAIEAGLGEMRKRL